jgi:hypothetical protein
MYQYRAFTILEYQNTGTSSILHPTILVILASIVKHTILEAPVFFIQQYW